MVATDPDEIPAVLISVPQTRRSARLCSAILANCVRKLDCNDWLNT
jgi:hypothetical protein